MTQNVLFTTIFALSLFLVNAKGVAATSTCEFPLLDEPTVASPEVCKKLSADPYQKNFLNYVCGESCQDMDQCLNNFETLRKDGALAKAYKEVAAATEAYPAERRTEKCGNLEPNPPVTTDDDTLWTKFRSFVQTRKNLNRLLKDKVQGINNACMRKDNTLGAFSRLKRTQSYKALLENCRALEKTSSPK